MPYRPKLPSIHQKLYSVAQPKLENLLVVMNNSADRLLPASAPYTRKSLAAIVLLLLIVFDATSACPTLQ